MDGFNILPKETSFHQMRTSKDERTICSATGKDQRKALTPQRKQGFVHKLTKLLGTWVVALDGVVVGTVVKGLP